MHPPITLPDEPAMKRVKNDDAFDAILDIIARNAKDSVLGARVSADNPQNHMLPLLVLSTFVPTLFSVDDHGNPMTCNAWATRLIENLYPEYTSAILTMPEIRKSTLCYMAMGQFRLDENEDHALIQYRDGVYNLVTNELTPVMPGKWGRLYFDEPFPSDLNTPLWDSFTSTQGYDEKSAEVFNAMCGRSLLFPCYSKELVVTIHGVPCSGKSQIQTLLHQLAGEGFTTVVKLNDDSFGLSGLESSKSCFIHEFQYGKASDIDLILALANVDEKMRIKIKHRNDIVKKIRIPVTVIGNRPLYDARYSALKRRAINLPFLIKHDEGTDVHFHERVLREEGGKLVIKLTRAWLEFCAMNQRIADWSSERVIGKQLFDYNKFVHKITRDKVLTMFLKSCFTLLPRSVRDLKTGLLKANLSDRRAIRVNPATLEYYSVTNEVIKDTWLAWTEMTGMDPGHLGKQLGKEFALWMKDEYQVERVHSPTDEISALVYAGLSLKAESDWNKMESDPGSWKVETPAAHFLKHRPAPPRDYVEFNIQPDFTEADPQSEEEEESDTEMSRGDIRSYFTTV